MEFINRIKNYDIDLDYDKFDKEDFFGFEKENMKIIRFIKESPVGAIEQLLRKKNLWS